MASLTPRIDSHCRNLAIGGNFDFWQRGTSFASANSYTADRWLVGQSGYTAGVTRSTDVPTFAQSGFQSLYSFLFTNGTGAAPGTALFQQIIHLVALAIGFTTNLPSQQTQNCKRKV
jgi:hypothetical protein